MEKYGMGRRLGSRLVAAVVLVAGLGALVAPAGAMADDATFNCDALALRLQVLTTPPIDLGTANFGSPACQNVDGTVLNLPSTAGLPLTGGILVAKTAVTADRQVATSVGTVTGLGVGLSNTLVGPILASVSQSLTGSATPIPLNQGVVPALLSALGLTGPATLSPTQQVTGLQPLINSALSNALTGSIAGVGLLGASASTTCVNNAAVLKGTSQVSGLKVLGQDVLLDPVTSQALSLLNTGQLSNVDLKATIDQLVANLEIALGVPTNSTDPTIVGLVNALTVSLTQQLSAAQPLLTALLTAAQNLINSVVKITVEPNKQVVANGQLTQTALHLNVTLLGNSLLDLVAGRARVSNASATCTPPPPPPPPVCSKRKLVLLDVFQQGNHAFLSGAAADRKFIGQTVPIYYAPTGKVVARATVGKDGLFQATAPLPPIGVRFTNKARYFARALGETSLRLKFYRRMHVTSLTSSGGKVQISGTLDPPLTIPVSQIVIQRRVSCTKTVTVKTISGTASGRFSTTLDAPPAGQVGVYRATSFVRQNPRSRKPFATFTLPRYVDIP